MAAVFRNWRWWHRPFCILINSRFRRDSCYLYQICQISNIYCEDWSKGSSFSKVKMATTALQRKSESFPFTLSTLSTFGAPLAANTLEFLQPYYGPLWWKSTMIHLNFYGSSPNSVELDIKWSSALLSINFEHLCLRKSQGINSLCLLGQIISLYLISYNMF